jgi:histidine triad (HIT) family protein
MDDCLFCKIVKKEIPAHIVWEDDKHLAFLTIYPNTEGFTVIVTKEHYSSYFAEVPEDVAADLLAASRAVAKLIDEKLDDVGRTALMFEGFGVNHLHSKLFPMHGTKGSEHIHEAEIDTYFSKYEGYISSHNGKRADDMHLAEVAKKIRQ